MKTKKEIVENWLPRYTGLPIDQFGKYILLTNFNQYLELFAQWHNVPIVGEDHPMPCATSGDITIINFSMGSANAATIMDLLSAIHPKAVLFLGKCGGIKKKNQVGDLILPIAAIRGEGTSTDYLPEEVRKYYPSFLNFAIGHSVKEFDTNSRHREIYLSLDLNAEELPGNTSFLKFIKKYLNFYHFPMPAVKVYPNVVWYGLKF